MSRTASRAQPDRETVDPPPGTRLLDLVAGHRVTAVIHAAARLGIADQLAGGPLDSAELAARTGTHAPSLRRLLRALVTVGVCDQVDGGAGGERFALTALGAPLARDAAGSVRDWVLFEGTMLASSWGGLLDSVRTGRTATELAGEDGGRRFALLARDPADARLFNDAMVALTRLSLPPVLAALDLTGAGRVTDVGGGFGELLAAILLASPAVRGTVLDLPHCAEGARRLLAGAGLADRACFVAGDFFVEVPTGADALVLKSIVHDWNDERARLLLENCRRALRPGARLLLVERLMPERLAAGDAEHRSVALSDLNMLRGPGGRERTLEAYRALLKAAGLSLGRVAPAGRFSVLEATAA